TSHGRCTSGTSAARRTLTAAGVPTAHAASAGRSGPPAVTRMAKTARERLAQRFVDSEPAGSFSAQLLAPAQTLQLEVSGVGPVHLPVRAPLAKKLIAVARPAMFGRGEQTLTDTGVRDTWELTPDQLTLGGPGWPALLDGA